MFVSSQGSPYARFKRAIDTGNLRLIRLTAAELPGVQLHDALAILPVIAAKEPAKYERAACRWLARFALERQTDLEALGRALTALDELPERPEARRALLDLIT